MKANKTQLLIFSAVAILYTNLGFAYDYEEARCTDSHGRNRISWIIDMNANLTTRTIPISIRKGRRDFQPDKITTNFYPQNPPKIFRITEMEFNAIEGLDVHDKLICSQPNLTNGHIKCTFGIYKNDGTLISGEAPTALDCQINYQTKRAGSPDLLPWNSEDKFMEGIKIFLTHGIYIKNMLGINKHSTDITTYGNCYENNELVFWWEVDKEAEAITAKIKSPEKDQTKFKDIMAGYELDERTQHLKVIVNKRGFKITYMAYMLSKPSSELWRISDGRNPVRVLQCETGSYDSIDVNNKTKRGRDKEVLDNDTKRIRQSHDERS